VNTNTQLEAGDWCFCPLCNEEIKKIATHTGREVDEYWAWVHEVKPALPAGFVKRISHSLDPEPHQQHEPVKSATCALS
jgi:hypothetical protein